MIRLMLADDEELERKYLMQYMERNYRGIISVVYAAKDGAELCEQALLLRPDIILMDIRMPRLDGLTAAQLLRQKLPYTELVILSAYGEFSYAKQAMKLGVKDFLVKPYLDEELRDTLDGILSGRTAIEQEEGKIEPGGETEIFYEILERNTVWGLCFREGVEDLKRELLRLGVSTERYKCVLFQNEGIGRLSEAGTEIIRRFFGESGDQVLLAHDFSYLSIFLFFTKDVKNAEIAQAIRKTCSYLENLENRRGTCGISGLYDTLESSATAFSEAEGYISDFSFPTGEDRTGMEALKVRLRLEKQLSFLIAGRNEGEAKANGSRLAELLRKYSTGGMEREMMRSMASIMQQLNEKNGPGIHTKLAVMLLEKCRGAGAEQVEAAIREMVEQMLASYKEGLHHGNTHLVRKVKQYIREHYQSLITQQKIAQELGVSQGYLSKCFKSQEGIGITEYLTEYRIEEAKKRMLDGARSVTDIAYEVGFSDSSYFGKCFRRQMKMSPSDFIAMHEAQ